MLARAHAAPVSSRRTPSNARPARGAATVRLATTVRRLRSEGGWTLEEVAERAGLDPRHIQLVESGSSNPTLSTLVKVARGLGSSLEMLVAGLSGARERAAPAAPRGRANEPTGSAACAHRVKVERLQRGWSQAQLAERVGMSVGAIQGLELGKRSPTVRTLDAIAGALGVQIWTLLVLQGEPAATSRTRASRRQPK